MDFKECPKCKNLYLKAFGFAKGKRSCLRCEGKPSAALSLGGDKGEQS